ncbi:MAG: Na+/H+ antiporter [Anaerolineales bacterium]
MNHLAETLIFAEEILMILLLLASVVAIFANRWRVPYTVGLVLIGLALTLIPTLHFKIDPEIILFVLVPPLIFEAAFHIRIEDLRRNWSLIALLAIPGVIVNMLIVAGIVSWGAGIAFDAALVFGALIAATDPVAVVALFRQLGAPKRLQVILEGESLFNDGTAIVLFGLMLAVVRTGSFSIVDSITGFLRVAGGGVVLGVVLGMLVSQIIRSVDNPMVENTLITVLAFGAYLLGEMFHVSGVLAVVAAGLVNGNVGPRGMSATTRVVVANFWEYAAFIANSLIFLFIGLTINVSLLLENWQAILLAIVATLAARAIGVYAFSFLGDLPWNWRHVLYWGGLRGAISLALALSLPVLPGLPQERLQAMAFGVVLFTLLVQGFSMERVTRWLELVRHSALQEEYKRRHARYVVARASYEYLQRRAHQGAISPHTWARMSPLMEKQRDALLESVGEIYKADPSLEMDELDYARREALRVQRNALLDLFHDGIISEEVYTGLVGEIDLALANQTPAPGLLRGARIAAPINRVLVVVVQAQDVDAIVAALLPLGVSLGRLPSKGSFLQRVNVTLVIGTPDSLENQVLETIKQHARRRALPALKQGNDWLPASRRVKVGGGVAFVMDVEDYYEL